MKSQFLGSFSGNTFAAYAKVCVIISEGAESLDDLSHQFGAYDHPFHRLLANANSNEKVWVIPEVAAAQKAVSEQYSINGGTFRSVRHSMSAFRTAVTQAAKASET